MKQENKAEIKQKKGFAMCFTALLALCAVSAVYGNETAVYEFRPADNVPLEKANNDSYESDGIDKSNIALLLNSFLWTSEKGYKELADSLYDDEVMKLAKSNSDNTLDVLDLRKDTSDKSRLLSKLQKSISKIAFGIMIEEGTGIPFRTMSHLSKIQTSLALMTRIQIVAIRG